MERAAELQVGKGLHITARPRVSLRRIARPSLVVGLAIVLFFLAVAVAAPLLAPGQGEVPGALPRYGIGLLPEAPSRSHPLGLMAGRYEIYYGLVWGARTAFRMALIVTLGRALIGIACGLVAGTNRGLADAALMRVTDAFLAFPLVAVLMVALATIPVNPVVLAAMPSNELAAMRINIEEPIVIAVFIAFGWMSYARLIRGNLLVEREKEYVQAARATGVRSHRLVVRHLFPNATHGLFVLAASDMGAVVLLLAAFNFIQLLGRAPGQIMMADWGVMLSASRNWIIGAPDKAFHYWYTYMPVCAAIILFSIGWNLVGDGLRDALDPRTR